MSFLKGPQLISKRDTLSVFLTALLFLSGLSAKSQTATEYQVKAVFIYNFVNFVEWPESSFKQASDPFVIGIVGTNVFGDALEQVVAGEKYKGHAIEIRQVDNVENVKACHIVFVEKSVPNIDQIITKTEKYPVLTVGDTDDFLREGGIIRLFLEQSKVRIEINEKLANERQIQISSKLLRFAKLYEK